MFVTRDAGYQQRTGQGGVARLNEVSQELRHVVVPEFVFGHDARHLVPNFVRNFGAQRVLLVTDPGVIAASWTAEVLDDLNAAGVRTTVFSNITTNPRGEQVMAGAGVYNSAKCEALVAVGGGSVIDCAKGIGAVVSNHRHVLEFVGVDQIDAPMPPLVCVSTTTTGADVSQFAIISDLARREKLAIISKAVMADVSLLDPVIYTTLPAEVTGAGVMDSLGQAIEAYVSNAHSHFTDLLALDAIRLIAKSMPAVMESPHDIGPRADLMYGTLQGGIAFSNASLGLIHAAAHSIGGITDALHGLCVASVLPAVIEYNYPSAPRRFATVATALGRSVDDLPDDEVLQELLDAVELLRRHAGAALGMRDLGVRPHDTPELVQKTMLDPTLLTNPRRPEAAEVEAIYERSIR